MIKVHEELIAQKAQAELFLQIHDELDVPLKVNSEVGEVWIRANEVIQE